MTEIVLAAALLAAVGCIFVLLRRDMRAPVLPEAPQQQATPLAELKPETPVPEVSQALIPETPPPPPAADALVLRHADEDALVVRLVPEDEASALVPLDAREPGITLAGRLGAMVQAVPAVATASEMAGRRLMEVVIRGDLIAAADGNGLRAIAKGAEGIAEHARLYEVTSLSTLVNVAAIWQVASVLVAQKHLADIGDQLRTMSRSIEKVGVFLGQQRKARIVAAYAYIREVVHAMEQGDNLPWARSELEGCLRTLYEVREHLSLQLEHELQEVPEQDRFGSKDEFKRLQEKLDRAYEVTETLIACDRVRVACLFAQSLQPGGMYLLEKRLEAARADLAKAQELPGRIAMVIEEDSRKITSRFNFEKTLAERRAALGERIQHVEDALVRSSSLNGRALDRNEETRAVLTDEHRYYLELDGSTVTRTFQVESPDRIVAG